MSFSFDQATNSSLGYLFCHSPCFSEESTQIRTTNSVCVLKDLPLGVETKEIEAYFRDFGEISSIVILEGKGYAYIEFQRGESAEKAFKAFRLSPPVIRGKSVYLVQSMGNESTKKPLDLNPPSRILLLTFYNLKASINVSLLLETFSQFGLINKIVIFQKKNIHALVEMDQLENAISLKDSVDGKIIKGMFKVRVQYTDKKELMASQVSATEYDRLAQVSQLKKVSMLSKIKAKVRANSSRSIENKISSPQHPWLINEEPESEEKQSDKECSESTGYPSLKLNLIPQLEENESSLKDNTYYTLHNSASLKLSPWQETISQAGPVMKLDQVLKIAQSISSFRSNDAFEEKNQRLSPQAKMSPKYHFYGLSVASSSPHIEYPGERGLSENKKNSVLIVKNLPQNEQITLEMMFNLFSLYGNILTIKFSFKTPGTALVEFQNGSQAMTALNNLDQCPVFGQPLQLKISDFDKVHMNSGSSPSFFKDFSLSKNQRFKVLGSKNFMNLTAPSPNLHISNIHPGVSELFFIDIFGQVGNLLQFNLFECNPTMGAAYFASTEDAVRVLMLFHNLDVEGKYLCFFLLLLTKSLCSSRMIKISFLKNNGSWPSQSLKQALSFSP